MQETVIAFGLGAFLASVVWICIIVRSGVLVSGPKHTVMRSHLKHLDWENRDEAWYTQQLHDLLGGDAWVRTSAGTFVDLMLDGYAAEVDRAAKWYECVGQAAHYAVETDRPPLAILVARDADEERYVNRALAACLSTRVTLSNRQEYHVGLLVLRDYEP